MADLGSHWDTLRAHLGALGPHLGAPGIHFGVLWAVLDTSGLHFEDPKVPHGGIFSIWWRFCRKYEKHEKTMVSCGFSMISGVRRASKFEKNLKNGARSVLERQNPGWDGQDRWDWLRKWPMCVQWGPICGKIVAQVESLGGGRWLRPANS